MGAPPQSPPPAGSSGQEAASLPGQLIFEHGRLISFKNRRVDPPSTLYIGPNDALGVAFVSTLAAATLQVGGRLLDPTGRIVPFSYTFQNTTPGAWQFFTQPLGEGFLLSISANSGSVNVQRGQMFVQVYGAGQGSTAFMNGYVDDAHSLNWPRVMDEDPLSGIGGIARAFPADPAAGSTLTYTVPNNLAQRLRSVYLTFQTSATVSNRTVQVKITNSTGAIISETPFGAAQAASSTHTYTAALGLVDLDSPGGDVRHTIPLPDIMLEHGDQLIIGAFNLQAGDQISSVGLTFDQWILDESF